MDFKLYAVRVFVKDWKRALKFYSETLGLKVLFEDEALGWAEFDTGEAHLAIEVVAPEEAESTDLLGRFVGLSLQVSDIEQTYESLTSSGVAFTGPPEKQPWGGTLAHFHDPDGNTLTLLG